LVDLEHAAHCLIQGEVVAYPTETVYGLGADASSSAALDRLFQLKGRERGRALSVMVPDLEGLARLAPDLSEAARRLCHRFWPGPLTLVVPVSADELSAVASPHGVGFRCSTHPAAQALARAFSRPVVSTSCNRSGSPPCRDPEQVRQVFGGALPVLRGEPAGGLAPSTVVAVEKGGRTELLREGAIPYARILEELAA